MVVLVRYLARRPPRSKSAVEVVDAAFPLGVRDAAPQPSKDFSSQEVN